MYTILVVLLDSFSCNAIIKLKNEDATDPNKTVTQAFCGYSTRVS